MKKLDVSIYAIIEFNSNQMLQIRKGLENGIDVSSYLNPSIKWDEMRKIRNTLIQLEDNCKR